MPPLAVPDTVTISPTTGEVGVTLILIEGPVASLVPMAADTGTEVARITRNRQVTTNEQETDLMGKDWRGIQ